jgi:hypothetical protein
VSTGNNDPRSFMREGQGRGTTDAASAPVISTVGVFI